MSRKRKPAQLTDPSCRTGHLELPGDGHHGYRTWLRAQLRLRLIRPYSAYIGSVRIRA
jgi:hypothetical protein